MRTIIYNGLIINEQKEVTGYIVIKDELIETVASGEPDKNLMDEADEVINASGCYVMPGVIDDQVHFREPGLTHKADIASESRAAAAGGVTSYLEMPNTKPPTVTAEALAWKQNRAAETSVVNYAFYIGATNDNADLLTQLDYTHICGIKLFMGSSTGNMLVDNPHTLERIFAEAPVLIATHCEQESIIQANKEYYTRTFGKELPIFFHPLIRSAEACYRSSATAVELATRYNARLHLLHLSTARELTLLEDKPLQEKHITGEVCVHHLWFDDNDYSQYGNLIKWNPAIKTCADRKALLAAVASHKLDVVATDHAPHLLSEKKGFMPTSSLRRSFSTILAASNARTIGPRSFSPNNRSRKDGTCPGLSFRHRTPRLFTRRILCRHCDCRATKKYTVTVDKIISRCGWSPFEGHTFPSTVIRTIVNGTTVYDNGRINDSFRGQLLTFRHN